MTNATVLATSSANAEPAFSEDDPNVASFLLQVRHGDERERARVVDAVRKALFESGLEVRLVPAAAAPDRYTPPFDDTTVTDPGAVEDAIKRGEARLLNWINSGQLVEGRVLEQAWGLTRQALDAARGRRELFSLWIKGQHWYPRAALDFERGALAEVNRALGDADPSSKFLFLMRKHGALGGQRPADAVERGRLAEVLRLAQAWGQA
jgi:hypothetical protein